MITFGNLSTSREAGERFPWAHALVAQQGRSILGVINNTNDWFRAANLHRALERLSAQGFFAGFDRICVYGSSMGGFGALTFAPLFPKSHAVVFAPQSTLDRRRASFETRYRFARRNNDWHGQWSDAAEGVRALRSGYLIYDPFEPLDAAHVGRLKTPALTPVKLRHFGHIIPPRLRVMGLLKPLALGALRGELESKDVRRLLSERKDSVLYVSRMLDTALQRGHYRTGMRAADKALQTNTNWKIRAARRNFRGALKADRT